MTDTGPHRFELGAWISCAPFERLLNITIKEAAGGMAVLTMPFKLELCQGMGLMHGGALVSLADTATVMAIKSLLPSGTPFVTISLASRFLHPVEKGTVTAKARVEPAGERRFKGEAVLYDDGQREVLRCTSLFKITADTKTNGNAHS